MFSNYVKIAVRSIAKNKLYAIINILGLTIGLAIYIFGGLFYDYENSHDAFYDNVDRTYTIRSVFSADAGIGVSQSDGVYSAIGPIVQAELSEVEAVARTIRREFLLTIGEDSFYQTVRFSDPELLEIFNFDYIYGDSSALNSSTGMLITKNMADKYFPGENPIGKSITLDHEHDLSISAVIKELPANTHFNSSMIGDFKLEFLIPINAMERITGFKPNENWGNISMGDLTYIMLPKNLNGEWLQTQMDGIYDRHFEADMKEFIDGVMVRPLIAANMVLWEALGIPAIKIIKLLGFLVLIVACVNYTNLATAQSMGRAREVGLRKTLGAGRGQLLSQFIVESLTITIFALLVALALLEIIIPIFNTATGKILAIDYLATLPWLLMTATLVGVLAGAYPAYLITKTSPIEALRDNARKGSSASWVRGTMIGVQFAISVFMLALVLVVYAQNKKVEQSSNIFSKDQIYTLDRLNVEQIKGRIEILRNEITSIPFVENFTLSSQVPYEQNNSAFNASIILNDFSSAVSVNLMRVDDQYIDTYNVPMIAGRKISRDISLDTHVKSNHKANVVINELAVQKLGFGTSEQAIGKVFYRDEEEDGITTFTVVGVMADQNILGLHNSIKPFVFIMRPESYRLASIKISKNATPQTVADIKAAWKRVYPDYPIQGKFLDETFQDIYKIFELGSQTLAGFALIALFLAAIGLFGLAAYMAEQRTKEIGLRKVMGANTVQIVKLLIWQFSKPVIWATPVALAAAYFVSNLYLEFFDDRIGIPFSILIGAGIGGLLLSWVTVASHAIKIARTNPIKALHYE